MNFDESDTLDIGRSYLFYVNIAGFAVEKE